MQIFPDASPERPVRLRCDCGKSVTLVAPPETWPLPCPDCSRPVRVVDPSTVGDTAEEERRLLAAPGAAGVPAVRDSGLPATRGRAELPEPIQSAGEVEIPARSFTGKPIRKSVKVRAPEVYGAETLAMAIWLASILSVFAGHELLTGGDFDSGSFLVRSVLFAVVTALFVLFQRRTVAPTLRAPRSPRLFFTVASFGIPVTVGFVFLYFRAIEDLTGPSESDSFSELLADPSTSLPLMILAVGILPGIFEELGFRGWMQSTWRLFLPPRRAIVLTACFFALAHFSLLSVGWLLPMGLYLGWLRETSGSIWPGVIAHLGHNTVVVLIAHCA